MYLIQMASRRQEDRMKFRDERLGGGVNAGSVPLVRALQFIFLFQPNLPNYALDRFSRYEYTLWRQVAQILFALDNLNRRKPQERKSSRFDYPQERCGFR